MIILFYTNLPKIKSVKKYLGSGYDVMASVGHVRDLPKSKLGVDIDNNFKPQYINMPDKKDVINLNPQDTFSTTYKITILK